MLQHTAELLALEFKLQLLQVYFIIRALLDSKLFGLIKTTILEMVLFLGVIGITVEVLVLLWISNSYCLPIC